MRTGLIILMLLSLNAFAMAKKPSADSNLVWVAKPDGATSCAINSGQSLDAAADELKQASIQVFQSQKGNDGKMHAQMCGLPVGTTNAYQIDRAALPKAQTLGFREVK